MDVHIPDEGKNVATLTVVNSNGKREASAERLANAKDTHHLDVAKAESLLCQHE